MAVLRHSPSPVPVSLLLADRTGAEQLAVHLQRPSQDTVEALETLWALPAPVEQRQRALTGLVADGLAARTEDRASLPG